MWIRSGCICLAMNWSADCGNISSRIRRLPAALRRGWICGLGHGILQKTPEANVRRFVSLQREIFG